MDTRTFARVLQEAGSEPADVGFSTERLMQAARTASRRRQRRRLTMGGVVCAAAAAGVVLLPSVFVNPDTAPQLASPTADLSMTPTPSASGSGVKEHLVDLPRAPRGPSPLVDWLDFLTLHTGDGATVDLRGSYSSAFRYGDGWLVANNYLWQLSTLDAHGNLLRRTGGADPVTSVDGTSIAWFERGPGLASSKLVLADPATGTITASEPLPGVSLAIPAGFTAPGVVVYADAEDSGTTVWWTDFTGEPHKIPGSRVGGTSQASGLASIEESSDSGCWQVLEVSSGNVRWSTCDWSLGQFSTDGRYVIGTASDGRVSALGRDVAILDARTGAVITRFQVPAGGQYVLQAAWEGAAHDVLAIVNRNPADALSGVYQIARLKLDGSVESATGPISVPVADGTLRVAINPRP